MANPVNHSCRIPIFTIVSSNQDPTEAEKVHHTVLSLQFARNGISFVGVTGNEEIEYCSCQRVFTAISDCLKMPARAISDLFANMQECKKTNSRNEFYELYLANSGADAAFSPM